ncbi:protein MTSS 1-like isoform X5 [Denticeps clupeoides]|uniref:protein MTSS 1-like isoform X5 n=1 Tax=Denticeps clupeoides TaxID=299321 RepID=UPI0010A50718|nr:protein MTSS 1-like isoform X5 [Denticeps clupeoides]XP_028821984.1 protein MTSS 1-like isoform X5 [Denticeps clupeoides]
METVMERECSALGGLFQTVITDMKSSYPIWEDFISKAGKLQSQLRTTVVAVAAFLDAFQKVADLATGSRGGTRDIGSALTRMCMRHRSIEAKLRQFSMVFMDCLINPLQDQMEEWKRVANTLDKDHAKEYKKARQEIKKKSSDTLKLQKKAKKADVFGRGDIQPQLDSAIQDVSDKYLLLEETEKQAVRKALIEERGRFCTFVSMLRPVVEEEMSMLGEITHLQTIADDLKALTMDPHKLPPASEQVIMDVKGSDYSWSYQTPPSSPSTTVSRKSSMCSSLNSVNSSDSRSSGSHSHSPTSHYRYRGSAPPQQGPARLSSVSSHDSGFISQDAYQSKSPSPMPPETSPQDWAKPGPYDQPMVNTLRRNKEKREPSDPTSPQAGESSSPGEDPQKARTTNPSNPTKEEAEAHEELAMALARGLQLDIQRSSRDSLQCSSGYSTQSTTPCCSEDTIPSQVSDYDYFSVAGEQEVDQQDFDKSSTIPRNSDISQSYRRMFQAKRPASTAGIPSNTGPVIVTPGVATIRRTPSSKPNLRRPSGGGGPIPIKTPVVPVKTPTVPELPGGFSFSEVGEGGPPSPGTPSAAESHAESPGSPLATAPETECDGEALTEETEPTGPEGDNMLVAIRGVKLKKTTTNDRSAPRIE